MSESEKRRHIIKIKLNDDELEKLEGYISKSNEDQSTVIREILFVGKLTVIEKNEDTQKIVINQCELLDELKKVGGNLNQAVKKLNASKEAKEVEKFLPTLDFSLQELEAVYKANYEVMNLIYTKW